MPWHRLCSGYATVAKRSRGNITGICFQFKQPNIINYIGALLVGMSIIYFFLMRPVILNVYQWWRLKKIVVDTDL